MSKPYDFGNGKQGTLNDLKVPKNYHYTNVTRNQLNNNLRKNLQTTRRQGGFKTQGNRDMIETDIKQLKSGQGKATEFTRKNGDKTTRFKINNRTYGVGGNGTMYPIKGPGLRRRSEGQIYKVATRNERVIQNKLNEQVKQNKLGSNKNESSQKQVFSNSSNPLKPQNNTGKGRNF